MRRRKKRKGEKGRRGENNPPHGRAFPGVLNFDAALNNVMAG
jgi:hypothetical protein